MKRAGWVVLGVVAVAAIGAFLSRRVTPGVMRLRPTPVSSETTEKQVMPVYFISADGSGLVAEPREIPRSVDVTDGIRAALAELLRGPQDPKHFAPIPAGATVRGVFVDRRKHAYCDFSHELRDNHPGGSFAEQMTVFSIVNTLTTDFPNVRKVQILIEGAPAETLAGHLDIGRALSKRLLLISKLSGQ